MDQIKETGPVRVRIAPSPTGDPHVGTAYVGLINYVFARQNGGRFIVRIEDTDQTRSSPVFEAAIFRSLRWFGLEWDEGPDVGGPYAPYRQSERTEIYQRYAKELVQKGGAYRCFCTSDRLDALREEQRQNKMNLGYDRQCRNLRADEVEALLSRDTPHVIRLKMPLDGETIIRDRLRGDVVFQNASIDDQVLLKSDGFPTYHLANVVDDRLMRITHVIRAEEWLISTPKHIMLYDHFGWQAPEFTHVPLLRNKDKSKISKRKNPVSLVYYEQAGYLPDALRNFLALMGWTHPEGREKFTLNDMLTTFSLDKLSLGGPIFDLEKLKWLNGLYIRELSHGELQKKIQHTLFDSAYLEKILPLIHDRIEVLEEFWIKADFFFYGDLALDLALLIPKGRTAVETRQLISEVLATLESTSREGWTAELLEPRIRTCCDKSGWKSKDAFMTLRIVVTGRTASPPLFETMEVLGKERIRRRFQAAENFLKTVKS